MNETFPSVTGRPLWVRIVSMPGGIQESRDERKKEMESVQEIGQGFTSGGNEGENETGLKLIDGRYPGGRLNNYNFANSH